MIQLSNHTGIVTGQPAFQINGEAQPRLNTALLSVVVEETTAGLYRCEARFGNWGSVGSSVDYLYFDRSLLDFGEEIAVIMGAEDAAAQVFKGLISAIEGQFLQSETPQIVILAEDAAQNLRLTRRTRTFEDVTDAEVFEQIAQAHGLQSDINIQGPRHSVIAQLNQSDLAFMRERSQRLAAEIWIENNTLHVQSRSQRQQDSDDFSLQFNQGLLEFNVTADTANQYTQVIVSGWDVQSKDALSYTATDSVITQELNGAESGASIINSKFGDRIDRITAQVPLSAAETQTLAEATFRSQARRFVVGWGVALGDARLRVGRVVTLKGLGTLFTGNYYLTEVRHIFNLVTGYKTEFVAERPGIGR